MALVQKIGEIPNCCAIVVGAWDPLFPEVEKGLRRLSRICRKGGRFELLPILIDPSPAAMLNPGAHPRFECSEARISRILGCGVRGVIKLRLSKKDLEQGIEFLLDLIGRHTEVKCVFLGKNQSLGSAGKGDPRMIRRVCEQREVSVLPSNISAHANKRTTYRLYKRNAFVQIASLLGRPLSWMGHLDRLRVPLKTGTYRAKIAMSNSNLSTSEAFTLDLDIDSNGHVEVNSPLHLDLGGAVWISPTRFLRQAK